MIEHVEALRAVLEPLGYPVPFVDASGTTEYPYLLVWGAFAVPGDEVALDDAQTDIDEPFGITSVAATPDAVLVVRRRVKEALTPGGRPGRLAVDGRAVWVRHEDARPVDVDRDVTLPHSTRHPAFGVDMYRLVSTPA